jgi:ornithine cyclodeaminase
VVRVLDGEDVRRLVGMQDAIAAVREALAAADRGRAIMPAPLDLRLPEADGELHVKGAYLTGAPVFAVKTATGFYRNAERGLPVSGGMTLIYDAETGQLRMLVLDGGLLTELRSAAAGAVAADLLGRRDARSVAVIGAGLQARFQLEALRQVRAVEQVRVWARRPAAADEFVREIAASGVSASAAESARDAVDGAALVITATSSSRPLIEAGWLAPGSHVTAMGSDMPHKHELDPRIIAAADKYVPDSVATTAASGELHHAIEAGLFDAASVYGELGGLASGRLPGRERDDELTVADLTGLGVQDAAMAVLVDRLAAEHDAGRDLPLGDS